MIFRSVLNIFFLFSALYAGSAYQEDGIISWKKHSDSPGQPYPAARAAPRSPQNEQQNGLNYLNELRKGAGLIAFNSNSLLDTATQNHTDYLILHDLFTHKEDNTTYPEGFTGVHSWNRGAAAGYNWTLGRPYTEIISAGNSDIYDSIDSHFSAIYHRFGLLSLKNVDIGIGISKSSSYKYSSAYGFNMANDGNVTKAYLRNPGYVLWPYRNYEKAQTAFSNYEDPEPMPECERGGVTANPVSIEFNPKKNGHISMSSFKLHSLDGSEINTKLITKQNDPAGKLNEERFVLFAMNSLDVNRWYRADFSYLESEANQTISWYFKTRSYPYDGYKVVKNGQYDVVSGKSYLLQIKPDDCNTSINGYQYSGAPVTVERLEYDLFKVAPDSATLGDITYFDFYNGMDFSLRVAKSDSAGSFDDASSVIKITDLPGDLNETSGMINIDGRLFLHNDGMAMPYLYEIDRASGRVMRTIVIDGAENTDWEDITSDDTYVYVADIGNSRGSRRDLKIYKISKHSLLASNTVSAEVINISYADQTKFTYDDFTTPYDAEALIAFEGKLYIFTKNWEDYTTNVYAVPTDPGTYELHSICKKQFDVMVTGADYDASTGSVALVGYSNPQDTGRVYKSMIIMLSDFADGDFFSGRIVTSEIKNKIEAGQIESIVFYGKNELYLSREKVGSDTVTCPARLFKTQIAPVFRISDSNDDPLQNKEVISALLFLLM